MASFWIHKQPWKYQLLLITLIVIYVNAEVKNLVTSKSIERIESSNLKKASNLIIDSNPKTCLRVVSPKKNDPRWIQLHFKENHFFKRLNVVVQNKNSNFSIFVIVEQPNKRTKFTRCAHKSNSTRLNYTHFDFQCPGGGLKGKKIFVRDDEKETKEFYVCEVQAFGFPSKAKFGECPPYPSLANGKSTFNPLRSSLSFHCNRGYVLWGRREIHCRKDLERWSGIPPKCRPLTCHVPDELETENTVFKLPKNLSRIHFGDEASVYCKEGLLLVKNSTQGVVVMDRVPAVCSHVGSWEIKTSFNCVNSTLLNLPVSWSDNSTLSIIHTVFIALSICLLFILVLLTLFLYKRKLDYLKPPEASNNNQPNPPLSRNSDRDTSTTTIYDDDIHIPDSGSLIRGPLVDDASIIREDCYKQRQLFDKNELFFRPRPLTTFKPNQNTPRQLGNIPTNYCVAWTQSHHATFETSDESGQENQSFTEQSSISCLPEKDITQHIYANVNDNNPGYASLMPKIRTNEIIYANEPTIQKHNNLFHYSDIQPL